MSSLNNPLAQKKCKACATATAPLKGQELQNLLKQLSGGWEVQQDHQIEKQYNFSNFREALTFTNQVGELAETEGHHPDIYLAWGKTKIILWTHKVNGLTEADFVFAAKCDQLFEKGKKK